MRTGLPDLLNFLVYGSRERLRVNLCMLGGLTLIKIDVRAGDIGFAGVIGNRQKAFKLARLENDGIVSFDGKI